MPKRVSGKWYGQAIFELALEGKGLESCQKGLDQLTELTQDEPLMAWLENPKLPFEAKERLLKEGLGEVHPFIFNLALLLVSKDSLRLASDIGSQYRLLFDAHRGLERAMLTSAIPLDEKDKEILSKRIGEILGRKVTFDLQVNPSLIGGFVARIGDTLIDGSVRQNLDSLGKSLLEVGRP
jgi:F-type H+-transporting ATPase subunit delta